MIMEETNMDSIDQKAAAKDDEVVLPGFRFHPTDEELVGFYLRRKVEKKPIRLEIIKQIDIYKYDPWDLPKASSVGDKEWYFFCIRGRKYKNSIRPNRVTGSGFWKATGIDKPVYTVKEPHDCIGLKKSLVFYRGSAGKGTKTDWMMHEFRLPPTHKQTQDLTQQPEVWTLCRIFKRIPSINKNYGAAAAWKDTEIKQKWGSTTDQTLIFSSLDDDSDQNSINNKPWVSLCNDSVVLQQNSIKPEVMDDQVDARNFFILRPWTTTNSIPQNQHQHQAVPFPGNSNVNTNYPGIWNPDGEIDIFTNGIWDELRSVVELAVEPYPHVYE